MRQEELPTDSNEVSSSGFGGRQRAPFSWITINDATYRDTSGQDGVGIGVGEPYSLEGREGGEDIYTKEHDQALPVTPKGGRGRLLIEKWTDEREKRQEPEPTFYKQRATPGQRTVPANPFIKRSQQPRWAWNRKPEILHQMSPTNSQRKSGKARKKNDLTVKPILHFDLLVLFRLNFVCYILTYYVLIFLGF